MLTSKALLLDGATCVGGGGGGGAGRFLRCGLRGIVDVAPAEAPSMWDSGNDDPSDTELLLGGTDDVGDTVVM